MLLCVPGAQLCASLIYGLHGGAGFSDPRLRDESPSGARLGTGNSTQDRSRLLLAVSSGAMPGGLT